MYGYVYLTENLANGMCYIGKKNLPTHRKSYYGSGKKIKEALEEYSRDNFVSTVIEWCETKEELNNREKYWINKCNASTSPFFYNIVEGQGSNKGHHFSIDVRRKYSEARKGTHHSEETKKKISDSLKKEDVLMKLSKSASDTFKGKHWKLVDGRRVWY